MCSWWDGWQCRIVGHNYVAIKYCPQFFATLYQCQRCCATTGNCS